MALTSIPGSLDSMLNVIDKLDILERVRNKLINNPDSAGRYLNIAMSQLIKSFQVIDDVLLKVVCLSFETNEDRKAAEKALRELQGNRIRFRIEESRGHCTIIDNIYNRHLRGWFSRVLDKDESEQMEQLFIDMRRFDIKVLSLMNELTIEIPSLADKLISFLKENKTNEATCIIQSIADNWSKPRQRLSECMAKLWSLQTDFLQLTGGIPY